MINEKHKAIQKLKKIPGIGNSLATDLWNIGMKSISDLKGKNPRFLFDKSNQYTNTIQDKCVLYVFRCAVYYANTEKKKRKQEKLKWWNWKDKKQNANKL
jgi:uncharacterized protein YdcH (DUF465 family)